MVKKHFLANIFVSATILLCGGGAMTFVAPPTQSEILSTSTPSEVSQPSKESGSHNSFTQSLDEIFEEITGVPNENACLILGDSGTSLVQPLQMMSIVDSCPQLSTIGYAVQLYSGTTSDYSGTATASNETETFTLTSSAEINMYQVSTENWTGTAVGYAITLDMTASVSGDSSIVAFYPVSIPGSELDSMSSRVRIETKNPSGPQVIFPPDCLDKLRVENLKARRVRDECESHCEDFLPMLTGVVVGAAGGAGLGACTTIPIVTAGGAAAGALCGPLVSSLRCHETCTNTYKSKITENRTDFEECLRQHEQQQTDDQNKGGGVIIAD